MLKKHSLSALIPIKRHLHLHLNDFVPKHDPVACTDIKSLRDFFTTFNKILVLTGAGISTESGIPDYRSEGVGLYARSDRRPMQYQQFLKSSTARQRYWARNFVGWPKFSSSQPNITHHLVSALESRGKVSSVVTQNVDGLHSKAGSRNVIELHGTAFRVVCLGCDASYDRHFIQEKLLDMNPSLSETSDVVRPDGDVEIESDKIKSFKPPFCESCGGVLKPDIIFFGDNVPRSRVDSVKQCVDDCDAVLVLGSSLTVFSGYRIILQASESCKYVAIVNIGSTRGDKHAHLKISARCGEILPRVFTDLDEVGFINI